MVFSGEVQNIGSAPSVGTYLKECTKLGRYTANQFQGVNCQPLGAVVPALNTGQSYKFTATSGGILMNYPHDVTKAVKVDPDEKILELNEDNNIVAKYLP